MMRNAFPFTPHRSFHLLAPLALGGCVQAASTLPPCAVPVRLPGGIAMSAEVPGTDGAARKRALGAALVDGLGPILGVGVKSKLEVTDAVRVRDGKSSESSDAREELNVSFGAAKVRDFVVTYCAAANGGTHADVQLSALEVARLKRIARDATLVVVACSSAAEGACTNDLRDRARSLAQGAGLTVADAVLVADEPSVDDLRARALSGGATKAFLVRLDTPTVREESPYFVCRAQASASLWDAEDGKSLRTAKPSGFGMDGGYKGVVYADQGKPRDACSKAFREALGAVEPLTITWAKDYSSAQ